MQPDNNIPQVVTPQSTSPAVQSSTEVPTQVVVAPTTQGQVLYAGFWGRWAAMFVDSLILGTVSFIINFVVGIVMGIMLASSGTTTASPVATIISGVVSLFVFALQIVYFVYFIGAKGQTPGKMAMKIKVVKIGTNEVPGFAKALLRETIGKFISALVFGLGYLWVAWDKDKQAWHDKIAGTVVIKV